jgi:hypothetical protein
MRYPNCKFLKFKVKIAKPLTGLEISIFQEKLKKYIKINNLAGG